MQLLKLAEKGGSFAPYNRTFRRPERMPESGPLFIEIIKAAKRSNFGCSKRP